MLVKRTVARILIPLLLLMLLLKLLVLPALALPLAWAFGLSGQALRVNVLESAMPTMITAAAGSASNTPVKPNRVPPANTAKITATGCSPMRSPSSLGCSNTLSST